MPATEVDDDNDGSREVEEGWVDDEFVGGRDKALARAIAWD